MTDRGIEFAINDDEGARVCVPEDDCLLLLTFMRDQRGEPSGAEAWEILSRALKRRNEARYWIITPTAAPVFADAIDRIAAAVRATDALLELRPHLPH